MQTFFGPWSVRVVDHGVLGSRRVVVRGSSTSDGVYPLDFDGAPTDLTVDGTEWTLDLQSTIDVIWGWASDAPARTTEVVPPQGLTVTLTVYVDDGGEQSDVPLLTAVLVSLDPELNPPWPTVPYDFTLPD